MSNIYAERYRDLYGIAHNISFQARIGGRVTIMPGVVIGREAFIGAVSLVTKDVPEFEIWCGHPAKKVGVVPQKERL